jgi:hypothetical protein
MGGLCNCVCEWGRRVTIGFLSCLLRRPLDNFSTLPQHNGQGPENPYIQPKMGNAKRRSAAGAE